MPDHDETKQHAGPAADAGEPKRLSRRTMLRGAASAGAAGVAATALAGVAGPALAGASTTRAQDRPLGDNETNDEVVVHVTDARAGKIDVFRGTSHVELTDRALAARLVRASR